MAKPKNRRQEIIAILRDRITTGEYAPGYRIPSQLDLAAEFSVAHRTVAHAIAALREDGYVHTIRNKGSYTRPSHHWRQTEASPYRTPPDV